MSRLRTAIIGLGVGEQHLRAYQREPDCEVVLLCDAAEEKLAGARARYPGLRLTRNATEVLTDPDVDLVSIASFDECHADQVVKALDAGKHVFVEKPLCRNLLELRAIKQAWARHGGRCLLTSNLVLRAAPAYRWLKEKLARGELGEPYAIDGDYLYGRLHKITEGWRKDVPDYSVMSGGGIHLIDLLVWLTGQRPTSVVAGGNRICTRDTGFRYQDYVAAMLRFPSGLIARLTANFGCVHGHQHVVRLFGTAATFISDDCGPRWQTSRDPAGPANLLPLATLPASKGDLIGPFVRAIGRHQDWSAETQAHFDVISICSACDASLRTGSMTEVHYV